MGFESPICAARNEPRRFLGSEPVADRYEIRSYECPTCKSVLRLVERTEPSMFAKSRKN